MSEMIERVAAAICGEASWSASSDNQKDRFRAQARDAITAMRVPTSAVRLALEHSRSRQAVDTDELWQLMIDAVLGFSGSRAE